MSEGSKNLNQIIYAFKRRDFKLILDLLKSENFVSLNFEEFKRLIKNPEIKFLCLLIETLLKQNIRKFELWEIFWPHIGKDSAFDNFLKLEIKNLMDTGNLDVITTLFNEGLINLFFNSNIYPINRLNKNELLLLKNTYEVLAQNRKAMVHEELCAVYFLLNDLDACIKLATKYIYDYYIDVFKASFYLGMANYKKKNYDKSLKNFKNAYFELDPKRIELQSITKKEALLYISKTYLKMCSYEEALSSCNNLINLTQKLYKPAIELKQKILNEREKNIPIKDLIEIEETLLFRILNSTDKDISFREKFIDVISNYNLSKYSTDLFNLLKFKIRMVTKYTEEDLIPIGASKFGGAPDLPEDIEWPYWNGKPLSFLMQIDLHEINEIAKNFSIHGISKISLPYKEGLLYFFYDYHQEAWGDKPKDKGSWRVLYSNEQNSNLIRTPNPSKQKKYTYSSYLLAFFSDVALQIGGLHVDSQIIENLNFNSEERDFFYKFIEDYFQLDRRWDAKWLFGYPIGIYNNKNEIICQQNLYNSIGKEEIQKWELLLQLGEIGTLDWGNGGYLQFWIKELHKFDFSKTWMLIESINTTIRFIKP